MAQRTSTPRDPRPSEGPSAPKAVAPRGLGTYPTVEGVASHRKDRTAPSPKRRRRVIVPVLAALLVLAGVAYAAGTVFFSIHFYPNTTIAGVDVGGATADEANERVRAATASYSLHVVGDGIDWTFAPEDPTRVFNADAAVQSTLGANTAWQWPARLYQAVFHPKTTSFDATDPDAEPDRSVLASSFDSSEFVDQLGAVVDAYNEDRSGTFSTQAAFDESTGMLSADRARQQERLDKDRITRFALVVLTHLGTEASLEDLGPDAYQPLEGGWTDDEIQAACDAVNGLLGADFDVVLQDSVVGHIDTSTLLGWITFDAAGNPTLDQAQLAAWAASVAAPLDTVGTERTYTRADGKQITVSGGAYGWSVDEDAVAQSLVDAVNSKRTEQLELQCDQTGDVYQGQGKPDWRKYVDVDLTEQHARLYDENGALIWESNIITGKPDGQNDTPTGVWAVTGKQRDTTLVSAVTDPATGKPTYESPVDYWIAFEGNMVGFHDASWQSPDSFNDPKAYETVGSHGCVNTPLDAVSKLYDLLEVGDCVVVHN